MTTRRLLLLLLPFLLATPLRAQAFLPDNFATSTPPNGAVLDIGQQHDGRVVVVGSFTKVGNVNRSRISSYTATGAFDPGFNPGTGANGDIHAVVVGPDNSIYIGGDFTTYGGQPANRIAKLNSAGRLDPTFGGSGFAGTVRDLAITPNTLHVVGDFPGGLTRIHTTSGFRTDIIGSGANGPVHAVAVDESPSGPIIAIGGDFNRVSGVTVNNIAFVDRDMRIKTAPAALGGANAPVHALEIDQPLPLEPPRRPRFAVGGDFTAFNGQGRNGLAVVYGDDLGWIGGNLGELATNLGTEPIVGTVHSLAFDHRTRSLAVGGEFTFTGRPTWRNLLIASSLEGGFPNAPWNAHQPNQPVRALHYQPDGMLVIGGDFTVLGGMARSYLARLYSQDGSNTPATPTILSWGGLDTDKIALSWEPADSSAAILGYKLERRPSGGNWSPVPLPDASITAILFENLLPGSAFFYRLSTFNGNGTSAASPFVVASTLTNPAYGTPDPAFTSATSPGMETVAIDAQQRLLVAGFEQVVRLLPDGSLDPSFTTPLAGGACRELAVQPDGRILIGGSFTTVHGEASPYLARLLPDGSLDRSFLARLDNQVLDVELLPDDRILVSGWFHTVDGQAQHTLTILHPDGSLDDTFRPSILGINLAPVIAARLAPDGNIVAGGSVTSVNGTPTSVLVKLTLGGELVPSFTIPPTLDLFDIDGLELQDDGRILLYGLAAPDPKPAGFEINRFLRLNANGSLDTTLGTESFGFPLDDPLRLQMLPQPDGSIIVSGDFEQFGGQPRFGLARIREFGSVDFFFTGGCGLQISRFGTPPQFVAVGAQELASLPDGRLAVAGSFRYANQIEMPGAAVLTNSPISAAAAPPATLTVELDEAGGLLLNWSAAANQTGYLIERSPSGAGDWSEIVRLPASWLRFVDTTALPGESFSYRLRGISGDALSTATSPSADGTALSPFQAWLMSWGLDSNSDPNSDPDGDNWCLFLEFALKWDPTTPEHDSWFESLDLTSPVIEIQTPRADILYDLEASPDGETWTSRDSATGGRELTLTTPFDPTIDGATLALRLRVTTTP